MKRDIKKQKKTSLRSIGRGAEHIPAGVLSLEAHVEDVKRYVDMVSEDFTHKVSAIAEQFLGLNEKLDSHTEMIGRLITDVEEIKVNMREKINRDEFNKLETRLVALESFVFSKHGKIAKK